MARPGSRRKARELALKALFMFDMQNKPDEQTMRLFWDDRPVKPAIRERTEKIVKGVIEHIDDIDKRIESASEHWRIDRMSRVDRNVLRLALYEMLIDDEDVPPEACIDEAVEIARRYGDTTSPAFINGVLDRILKEEPTDDS